jgi:hypothetical protein
MPNRPLLHARSITSPSAPASYHLAGDVTSDDESFPEDVFSDGDDERPSTAIGDHSGNSGSFFLENVIRPLTQGTRSRMRRMTGGRSRDGGFPFHPHPHLLHSPAGGSGGGGGAVSPPSQAVPKVPGAFLQLGHQLQQGQGHQG